MRSSIALLVVVLAAISACATARRAQAGEEILVVVQNNVVPPTSLTVRIRAESGSMHLLGNVSPQSTRSFSYEPASVAGEFYLSAVTTDGRDIVSRGFRIVRGDAVEWNVRLNTVDFN